MSLLQQARTTLGKFGHLGKPAAIAPAPAGKSTPAKAEDDDDKKDKKDESASDDDKKDEKKEDASDDDKKDEKAEDKDEEKAADDDEDEDDKKKKDAASFDRGFKAGGARWSTVLAHANAAGRIETACSLLDTTSMDAKAIIAVLGSLPAAATPAAAGPGLRERMGTVKTPAVGADDNGTKGAGGGGADSEAAKLAAQITGSYMKALNRKAS